MPAKKDLPADPMAERFILGTILLDGPRYADVTGAITLDAFFVTKHQLIWQRMTELAERSETINYATVASELTDKKDLNTVSLEYLLSLTDGMPVISDANLKSYVGRVVEKYRKRKAIAVAERILVQANAPDYTADEISLNGQAMLADQVGGFGSSQIESVREFVENYPGGVNALLNPQSYDKGIATGFTELDEWTSGMHASEIFLIGARPASGKTAMASNIAKRVALENKAVAFFSLELTKTMLLGRMFTEHAYVSYSRFRSGGLTDDERRRLREAMGEVMDLPLYIDDTMGLRVSDMRVKLNKIARERTVELIVCDYAQLIKAPRGVRFNTENDRITAVCEELKVLCKETKVPLLLLSQLNRDSEKSRGDNIPKLSQARGGGAFEEICYVGGCLHRAYQRKPTREELRDQCDLIIDKNRSGRAGTIELKWTGWALRFSNPDPAYSAPAS